jgi:hypothetical protein
LNNTYDFSTIEQIGLPINKIVTDWEGIRSDSILPMLYMWLKFSENMSKFENLKYRFETSVESRKSGRNLKSSWNEKTQTKPFMYKPLSVSVSCIHSPCHERCPNRYLLYRHIWLSILLFEDKKRLTWFSFLLIDSRKT